MTVCEWGSIGYPKRRKKTWKNIIVLHVATPLIYYLAIPNNFVGSNRDDVNKILIIYLI